MTAMRRTAFALAVLTTALVGAALFGGMRRTLPLLQFTPQIQALYLLDLPLGIWVELPTTSTLHYPSPTGEHTMRLVRTPGLVDLMLDDRLLFSGEAFDVTWAPDGSRVAVEVFPQRSPAPTLYIMRPTDDVPTVVGAYNGGLVSRWSADGRWLAYTERIGPGAVALHLTDGTQPDVVSILLNGPSVFNWSPGASKLAYITNDHRAHIFDAETGLVEDLPYEDVHNFHWSSTGEQLLITQLRQGDYTLRLHDGPALDVRGTPRSTRWSPDGRWLAILTLNIDMDGENRLSLIDTATTPPTTTVLGAITAPSVYAWSADSRYIAYEAIAPVPDAVRYGLYDVRTGAIVIERSHHHRPLVLSGVGLP